MKNSGSGRFSARLGVVLVAGVTGLSVVGVPSAVASTLGGTASVGNPSTSQPLSGGGSTTVFTVLLPAQAACSGDTATNGYHVWDYVVPPPTGAQTLTSELQGVNWLNGEGSQYYPLVSTGQGTGWAPANTAAHTGQIIQIPLDFTWQNLNSLLVSNGLSPLVSSTPGSSSTYDIGIACTDQNTALSDYWNQVITFNQSSSDPNGFTWTAQSSVQTPEVSMAVILPIIGAGLLGVGVVVHRRRRVHLTTDEV